MHCRQVDRYDDDDVVVVVGRVNGHGVSSWPGGMEEREGKCLKQKVREKESSFCLFSDGWYCIVLMMITLPYSYCAVLVQLHNLPPPPPSDSSLSYPHRLCYILRIGLVWIS